MHLVQGLNIHLPEMDEVIFVLSYLPHDAYSHTVSHV